jgi:fumarate hydratase subunit beta
MTPSLHRLRFPLSAEAALKLRAGDLVVLSGEILVTAGLPTHQRLLRALEGHEPLPLAMKDQSLFHIGSYSEQRGHHFDVRYINPTTSTRFNPYMPTLIRELGLHAVGGKGGLDSASVQALRQTGGVYLSFLGGGCTPLTQAVKEVLEVGWPDMLTHYRIVRLRVEGLGPTTVGIDAHGNSLYEDVRRSARQRLPDILAELARTRKPPES